MRLAERLQRFLAPDNVHRQLYPGPVVPFSIRKYDPRDKDAILALHDLNAPGRFPEGSRPTLEAFLLDCDNMLFVAEHPTDGVIACGGVFSGGPQAHTLCYGMVAPRFQGKRIGSTLALSRLAFATRTGGMNFSLIFAVDKSMPFYERFGYKMCQKWKGEDQREYPIGVLYYDSEIMKSIECTLAKRGHCIERKIPLMDHPTMESTVTEVAGGQYEISFKQRSPAN